MSTSGQGSGGVDSGATEIGAATRQRPAPRHQEQESMMQPQPTACARSQRVADAEPTPAELVALDVFSVANDAFRVAADYGQLLDREEGDEVTYLMLVEAKDLLNKAARRMES
jgi:hypothetical protein